MTLLFVVALLAVGEPKGVRYTTLFTEDLDGVERSHSSCEGELIRILLDDGTAMIDEAQSRQIRALADASSVVKGQLPEGLGSFDADLLIAGVAHLVQITSAVLPQGLVSYAASVDVRVIRLDTGAVVGSFHAEARALGFDRETAAAEAASKAAGELAPKIRSTEVRQRVVEFHISGLPSAKHTEEIARRLESLPQITNVRVVHARRDLTKLLVESAEQTRRLAAALDEAALGLSITGYSDRLLTAEYRAADTARRRAEPTSLVVSPHVVREIHAARSSVAIAAGRVGLQNRGEAELIEVELRARLPAFVKTPFAAKVGKLGIGELKEVPIELILDREALIEHRESSTEMLEIEVEYTTASRKGSERSSIPILVHHKNAIAWDVPESAAGFVTPREQTVSSIGEAVRSVARPRDSPLLAPVAIYEALRARKLRRSREDFDSIQFPRETLARGSGDADDFAVLYASIAESIGLPVLLLAEPAHLLVAVSTGMPPQAAGSLDADPRRVLVHRGRLWIPLDTSDLEAGFRDAWKRAASEQPGRRRMIEVRSAWSRFPPLDLADRQEPPAGIDREDMRGKIDRAMAELNAERAEAIERELARASSPEAKATALAQLGRRREAESLLAGVARPSAAALNNLGNLRFLAGKHEEALALYERALQRGGADPVRLHANAAIAAIRLGRSEALASHVAACLDRGADETIEVLTRAGASFTGAPEKAGSEPRAALEAHLHWLSGG